MRPSHPQDAFPSTPSSACSGGMHSRSPSSADHEPFSPPTPYECFSPAPAIVDPDDFTFHIDVQLDRMVGSPHNASITHLLPQSVVPSPITEPCLLSGDETSKMQVYMRNKGRWGPVCDRFESSPSPHPCVFDDTTDDFSWEVAHSPLLVPDQLPEPSRCSLLIHEVSLLVGLTQDDAHPSPNDHWPLVPDPPVQVHGTLPLNITPSKSLTSGKLKNAGTNSLHSPSHPFPPCIPDMANQSLNNHAPPLAGSRDPTVPIPRYKSSDASCPSLSPRRRQGQVFHIDPPCLRPVDFDETFCHPRQPPPKPSPNRASSLDKLEHSLRKLEAHAPRNHRKSRSEGRPSGHVSEYKVSHPSLPPPPRFKQKQSSYEKSRRTSPRTERPRYLSGPPPVPRPIALHHHHVAPPVCLAAPSDDGCLEEGPTPGSFMDMDIPPAGDPHQRRRASLRQVNGKEKTKGLLGVAKRVIAWGKNLTTKPPQKTTG